MRQLWEAAQDRMNRTRATIATANGPRAIVQLYIGSKYLLSGFTRCATCGWSMTVITRSHGKTRTAFLGCLSHHKRDPHVCPNGELVPLAHADDAMYWRNSRLTRSTLASSRRSSTWCLSGWRLEASLQVSTGLQREMREVESVIGQFIWRAPSSASLTSIRSSRRCASVNSSARVSSFDRAPVVNASGLALSLWHKRIHYLYTAISLASRQIF